MFKESQSQNSAKNKGAKLKDSQLNLYDDFDRVDKTDIRSANEIAENIRKNIVLADARREEKKRTTMPDKYAKLNGKSFKEIAEEVKKEEEHVADKLKQTRQEIKNETEYPEKPISADDDFIEPFGPAEEYYGRWK